MAGLQLTIILTGLALFADASGFMTFPPPRRYRGRGGRPWLRRFEWDQFNRMAIEDLPEPLPEWDMYCRGIPFDSSADQVQRLSPGGEVGVEWDIVQPDGGTCAIKLVCPSRQFKQELWRGPCGISPGKARSQAMIPSNFSCSKGECFVAWFYETASRRRYCNCFDIEVPSTPSQVQPSETVDTAITPEMPASSPVPTDNMPLTSVATSSEAVVFTSSETFISTDVSTVTNIMTSMITSVVELPGSSLEGGVVKTESLPTIYMTAAPSSKIELSGMPLGSTVETPTCSSDTIIVTMMQTLFNTVTNTLTTTCTETSIMTMPVERVITSFVTSTCTETLSMISTVTESAMPSTQTVYMTSMQTAYITTTISAVPSDTAAPESAKTESVASKVYQSTAPVYTAPPMTAKMPRAPVKYY